MKLMKTATEKLFPTAQVLIQHLNILTTATTVESLEGILKGLTGHGYGVALQSVNEGTIERLSYDLNQGRVNINLIPSDELLESVSSMQPARADKYRRFINTPRLQQVNNVDRPTVQMNSLSDIATFTLLYTGSVAGNDLSIRAVVVLYGSSLTSWADASELKQSQCNLSKYPSTHFIDKPEHFVNVFQ